MYRTSTFLLATLVLITCGGGAFAQVAVAPARGGGRTLSLDDALRRSLRHNPEIAKLDATLADKLGRAIEAEVKLNPEFKVTGGRTSESEGVGSEFEFEIEQPLRPSDFGLRKTYANALRAAANLEQQADVLRLLNATAVVYYRAWSLQERGAILARARGQADDVLETIEQQLAAGQSNVSQRSIFEAEAARFSAELLAVRGEQAGAQAELERATGTRLSDVRLATPTFPALPGTRELVAFAESRSGIRRIALAQRAAAAQGPAHRSGRCSVSGIRTGSGDELRQPERRGECRNYDCRPHSDLGPQPGRDHARARRFRSS
jgi:outer membrane protein TolC